MTFSLVHNFTSLESQSKLSITSSQLNQTVQRLSSGLRINQSGDDAAGLAIANKFRGDIKVLDQGVRNANDGLSSLQIIDGGLNTISNLLDRAATLSAQSASDTFTGNRDTLQSELSKVLSEITRQAQNIGLVSNGSANKSLTTVIGGGSDNYANANTNNGVQIDLSGAANRVDATSLGLNAINIGSNYGSVTGGAKIQALGAAETLTFQVADSGGNLQNFNVALTSGDTGTEVVNEINADTNAQSYGIKASLDSTGKLQISSSSFFTVKSGTAATGAGDTTEIGTAGQYTTAANHTTVSFQAAAAGTQNLDFTIGSSGAITRVQLSAAQGASAATVEAAINNNSTLNSAGIYAVNNGGTISIVSSKQSFGLVVEAESTAAAKGLAAGVTTVTAATGSGGASGARAALDAIKSAVLTLGQVQGAVGAGQNRLHQAIDLASSQITNFQAAESRIRDADVSAEASNLARLTVLQQAGIAALAQANQSNQAVLSLLR